jgi:hypothetical protein
VGRDGANERDLRRVVYGRYENIAHQDFANRDDFYADLKNWASAANILP